MTRNGIVCALILCCVLPAHADRVLREFTWDGDWLRVSNESGQPLTQTILEIEAPPITGDPYAITGRVKYEDVEGTAYIEMWNHFGAHGAFFSRTLMEHGPMKSLSGSSDWREFHLPFQRGPDVPPPERLVVNIVLPGRGTVYVSPLKLVQPDEPHAGTWWTGRQSNLLGAGLGVLLGGMGALIGVLASRGRARRLVLGAILVAFIVGIGSLLLGLVAARAGQPYHVFSMPLLIGAIYVVVPASMARSILRQYESWELRRMQSLDS